jgi:very-short-patch-repair endonuclease
MGHPVSESVRRAVSAAHTGRKHSAEATAQRAEKLRQFWANASPEKRAQRAEYAQQNLARRYGTGKLGLTKPEQSMAARLTEQGVVYEAQHVIGSFLVDFYLPATNTIIEVNGCYWHGCRPCGFEAHNLKGQARDKRKATYFAKHGYKLITVWEHDLT